MHELMTEAAARMLSRQLNDNNVAASMHFDPVPIYPPRVANEEPPEPGWGVLVQDLDQEEPYWVIYDNIGEYYAGA